MIRNKYIILPFLLIAWTIIFAHSIVPHHHHFEERIVQNDCHHESHHEHHDYIEESLIPEYHCCTQDSEDHACHFHVETLTQISIDNIFISNDTNPLFSDLSCIETTHTNYIEEFVSGKIPKANHLRGPPIIS